MHVGGTVSTRNFQHAINFGGGGGYSGSHP
jgi:hypothetical protein